MKNISRSIKIKQNTQVQQSKKKKKTTTTKQIEMIQDLRKILWKIEKKLQNHKETRSEAQGDASVTNILLIQFLYMRKYVFYSQEETTPMTTSFHKEGMFGHIILI